MTNAELLAKVEKIMETVDDRHFAAELILDVVVRGIGQRGGRPRRADTDVTPEMEVSKPVTEIAKPVSEVSKPVMKPAKTHESALAQNLLFSESEKIQKDTEKKEKTSSAKQSLLTETLSAFAVAWWAHYGTDYRPTGGDRMQLGKMIQPLTPDEVQMLPKAFEAYLADPDPFFSKTRHSLMLFCTQGGLNRFRPVKARPIGPIYPRL